MGFDQLSYRKIPIWENYRRVKILNRFREPLNQFNQRLNSGESVQSQTMRELQRLINHDRANGASFIRLADLSSTVPPSQADYASSRSKHAALDAKLDLIDGFFWQNTPGFRQDAIDLVDRAIGRYSENKSRAWRNAFNPLLWFDWLVDLSFNLVALFGRDPREMKKLYKGRVERLLGIGAALATILGFVLHVFHLF